MSFFLFVILELRPEVWGTQDGINQKHRFKNQHSNTRSTLKFNYKI